ncbi:hypothetical protein ACTUVN_004488 [Pseudomonas caspiana]
MKHTITIDIGVDVADIPAMRSMSGPEYTGYLEHSLFWTDHHEVLRATHGEYPIATNPEQVERLITWLKEVADEMRKSAI